VHARHADTGRETGTVSSDCHYLLGLRHPIALPRRSAKHCDEYVCLSVCPLAYHKNHTTRLHHSALVTHGSEFVHLPWQ